VVAGREFTVSDALRSPKVFLVNQAFAHRYWPDQNPLGKPLQDGVVVGVIADIRSEQLSEPATPTLYAAMTQGGVSGFTLLIKTENNPAALAPVARRALSELDDSMWPPQIETLEEAWTNSLAPQRALLTLFAFFSLLAVGLASVGLYGFVACSVAQRTKEIGIRIAVGARLGHILLLILRQSMGLVLLGLVFGLLLALMAARLAQGFFYGVSPADPLALAGVVIVLLAVTSVACWLPARRAAKVDPVVALRAE
jgi:ABC-type antimicrobial peptide transport system permease subunit